MSELFRPEAKKLDERLLKSLIQSGKTETNLALMKEMGAEIQRQSDLQIIETSKRIGLWEALRRERILKFGR